MLELSVDVDELLKFASDLERALKGVKRERVKGRRGASAVVEQEQEQEQEGGPVNVILNATGLHWLLGQVAYDTGVRQLAVPGAFCFCCCVYMFGLIDPPRTRTTSYTSPPPKNKNKIKKNNQGWGR